MKWVLKVGGSLYSHPELERLLAHAQHLSNPAARCTIVPGGGPFADQVRAAYKHWRIDEQTAHQMAILGMRQYGRLLAHLSKLPTSDKENQPKEQCVIWLPSDNPKPACLTDIPAKQLDWEFTSDSISICVANYIQARYLILLKAVPADKEKPLAELVDKRFSKLMQATQTKVVCCSAEQWLNIPTIN